VEYFRELDSILGELFSLTGPEDTVLIASDHGFGAQTGTFFVNAWLAKKGYLAWAKGSGPEAAGSGDLGMEQLARHVYLPRLEPDARLRAHAERQRALHRSS
jgi:predicted AlkP superfamily phosphohydrolase/phosphomutase